MATKLNSRPKSSRVRPPAAPPVDAELEGFLAERHDEVEAKLQKARRSIARGRVKLLEPLPSLLRAARRRAKTER
jgi:hypothetical protein